MEKIEGMAGRRADVLHRGIAVGRLRKMQARQIRGQEHQPMLVGAVVRTGAVLVLPTVLMPGRQAVFMPVVASSTVGMRGGGGRGLVMDRTITEHANGRLRERTHHEQQGKECGEAATHRGKAKPCLGPGQDGPGVTRDLQWWVARLGGGSGSPDPPPCLPLLLS